MICTELFWLPVELWGLWRQNQCRNTRLRTGRNPREKANSGAATPLYYPMLQQLEPFTDGGT